MAQIELRFNGHHIVGHFFPESGKVHARDRSGAMVAYPSVQAWMDAWVAE